MSQPPDQPMLDRPFAAEMQRSVQPSLRAAVGEPPAAMAHGTPGEATFLLALQAPGRGDLGWLGMTPQKWATRVTRVDDAIRLEMYPWSDGHLYFRPLGSRNVWLSVSDGGFIGFYDWNGARGWTFDGDRFKSDYNGRHLSLDLTGAPLLKTDEQAPYTVLTVRRDAAYTSPIRHVFVLMLENRSFDHMLGFSGITGTDAVSGDRRPIDGLAGSESNVVNGQAYRVTRSAHWSMPADPNHELPDVAQQLCGFGVVYPHAGAYPPVDNSGFAADYATVKNASGPAELMKCYDPRQLPTLVGLAREYAVCDRWFSSMPGPTWPNRLFVHAASAGGLDNSPGLGDIISWETGLSGGFGFENGSLFNKQNLSWAVYVHNPVFANVVALQGVRNTDLGRVRSFSNALNSDGFAKDLRDGNAAQYTFIEPDYGDVATSTFKGGNSQHPMDDVRRGDLLIASVYNAIRNSPLWESSLLIVTWDEHGGFYDHVPPPPAPSPGDRTVMANVAKYGFTFAQYGVRVPALVISPLIPKNVVDGRLYDHASVPATVEALFRFSPLTQRDRQANNLTSLLSLPAPRKDCPPNAPTMPAAALANAFPAALDAAPPTAELAAKRQESIDQGNVPAFVHAAMCTHLAIAPNHKDAILSRVAGLKTLGDAEAYIDDVRNLLAAAERAAPLVTAAAAPPQVALAP